jgi:hypothetical protein
MAHPPGAGGTAPQWIVDYVPSLGIVRSTTPDGSGPVWMRLTDDSRAGYRVLTRGMAPLPASRLPGVRHAAPVAPRAGDGGVPAWLIALAGAGALAAAGTLVARRRGRGRLAPAPPV